MLELTGGRSNDQDEPLGENRRPKSPRYVRNRNTKNLSLSIGNSPTQRIAAMEEHFGVTPPVTLQDPVQIANITQNQREAQIFSLSSVMNSAGTSPVWRTSSGGTTNRAKRGMSLPLSLKTVNTRATSFDKDSHQSSSCPIPASPAIGPQIVTLGSHSNSTDRSVSWVYRKDASLSSSSSDDEHGDSYTYPEVYKENAYPSGPLLVYGENVYLYSEPTFEDVLNFDVVINVAQEVQNFGLQLPLSKQLDYHHVEWTHTSKICSDLPRLTQIIHQAELGKRRVLVHCQCGVSRSASLIVAYIMRYQSLALNEAYNMLKSVATDISPNMSLIFQLMEWNEVLTTQGQRTPNEKAHLARHTSPSSDLDKAIHEPANLISQQNTKGFSSPNCPSISTDGTPCTPQDFISCDQFPTTVAEHKKSFSSSRSMVSAAPPHLPSFTSFTRPSVEIGEKAISSWN